MSLHNAPPVIYPLGRSYWLGALLLGVWLGAGLLVLAWAWLAWPAGWRQAGALVAWLVAGLAARSSWNHAPGGQLAWDGQAWHWESASEPAIRMAGHELVVVADFQRCLLLRLHDQAGACLWLWAEQQGAAERWLDLRRAVYSPRRSGGAPASHDLLSAQPSPSSADAASAVAVSTALHPIEATRTKP